jgi:hypothetical protein
MTRITNDILNDDNPQMAIDPKDNFVLTWIKENEISSVLNFDMDHQTVIHSDEYSTNLAAFKLANSSDGKLAIVWAEPSDYSSDLYAIFYNPAIDVWGNPKQMTFDAETESNATAAFYGNTLVSIYNRNLMGQTPMTRTLANGKTVTVIASEPIQTDLYMLLYTKGDDLALENGSLIFSPANPVPGDKVTLTVKAMNLGERPFNSVPIFFYLGDPDQGGNKIGEVTISEVFNPGDTKEVSISWTVPDTTKVFFEIYAVIDPLTILDPINRTNNKVSNVMGKSNTIFPIYLPLIMK